MQNDLISRKALLDEYDRVHVGPPGGARKLIEDAPRVDAVDLPHWATERAYKNGYEKGYADALAFAKNELKPIEDDVKEILQMFKQLVTVNNVGDKMDFCGELCNFADGLIQKAKEPKWIPVTEGLPKTIPCGAGTEYSEAVNVLTSGRKVLTAIFDGTEFIADAEFWEADGEEITHWTPVLLPLPEPPKGE